MPTDEPSPVEPSLDAPSPVEPLPDEMPHMRRPLSLGTRLSLGAAALVLMTAGTVAWGVVDGVVGDLRRALELRGGAVARDLAEDAAVPLAKGDFAAIEMLLVRVWDEDDLAHVSVRDLRGRTVAARAFPAAPINEAVVTTPITSAPDEDGFRGTVGTVRVVLSGSGNAARQKRYYQWAARLAGGIAIIGVLLAILLAWLLVKPLRRLQRAATAMIDGTYGGRVEVQGAREIADLSALINEAMGAIAGREAELKTAYAQLKQAERARESMTHMLVHDLKGPISNVRMLLDLLEEDADPDDKGLLIQGRDRCAGLLSMIDDLLAMGRLEQEEPVLELAEVPLDALLAEALADVQHLATRRRAQITIDAPSTVVGLDRRLMRRV
ncbi:MAG: signal transduction histidine kinase, partial [Bradymonadia bacterium]